MNEIPNSGEYENRHDEEHQRLIEAAFAAIDERILLIKKTMKREMLEEMLEEMWGSVEDGLITEAQLKEHYELYCSKVDENVDMAAEEMKAEELKNIAQFVGILGRSDLSIEHKPTE